MDKLTYIKYYENSFVNNWDLPAMTDYVTKESFTYGEVAEKIAKLHVLFKELNIRKEDKIAIVGNNNHIWAITFLAVETYGAVAVPILKDFHSDDIQHIINHSDSALLFLTDNIWENIDESKIPNVRGIFSMSDFRCLYQSAGETIQKTLKTIDSKFQELYPNGFHKEDVHYDEKDDEELVMISYTSGTTGYSKGVMIAGKNFRANIAFALDTDQAKRGYNILNLAKTGIGSGSIGAIAKGKWTKNKVFEVAKTCKTRTEFSKKYKGAYVKALNKGWLSEMTWFENGFILMWRKRKCAA